MKKRYLIIAAILIFIAAGMAFSMGMLFTLQFGLDSIYPLYHISLTGAIFTLIAGLGTLITFVFAIVVIVKKKWALCTALLAYLFGIVILSCAFTPIFASDASSFVGLTVTAGIIDVLVGAVFLAHFVLINSKKSSSIQRNQSTGKQLKLLEKLYNKNLLTAEEYAAKKEMIIGNAIYEPHAGQNVQHGTKKKPIITSVVLSALVAVYCIVVFPIISSVYRSNVYDYILDTISSYSKEYLDYYLAYLPNDYRDTRSIKNTYEDVQYYLYDNHVETLRRYVELNKIEKYDYRWNFERIFDNISWFEIYNVRWYGEQIWIDNVGTGISNPNAYFEITRSQNSVTLFTNLPNNQESAKSYYFYTEYESNNSIIFGYENQNNKSDRFRAYRVTNIKYNSTTNIFSLNVYCYSNSKTYTLEYEY